MSVLAGFNISPPDEPTLADGTVSGDLTEGSDYKYAFTLVTNFGETTIGTPATIEAPATGSVLVTGLPELDSNIVGRKLYRTVADGNSYKLLAELDDSATNYVDVVADGELGNSAPAYNSAGSLAAINGSVQVAHLIRSFETGITATGTTQADAYQLEAEFSIVTTTAASTGVILPHIAEPISGTHMRIKNAGAETLAVYPALGQTINGGAANASVNVTTGNSLSLISDGTNWISV